MNRVRLGITCLECSYDMRFSNFTFKQTGICEWTCWQCEQTINTTDLRDCIIWEEEE